MVGVSADVGVAPGGPVGVLVGVADGIVAGVAVDVGVAPGTVVVA
jgi:hypothetical protein